MATMSDSRGGHAGLPFAMLLVMFVPGHMFNWAVEWAWLGVQVLAALVCLLVARRRIAPTAGIDARVWVGFFLLVTAAGCWSDLYASLVLNIRTSSSDVPDLLRFMIFIPLALFIGATMGRGAADQLSTVLKMVVVFNLVTAAILIARLPVLEPLLMAIYDEAKIQYDFGSIRIGIPFTNPNFAALVFVLALGYFAFFKPSRLFFVLTVVSLFITGSRSGFLAAMPILFLVYLLALRKAAGNPRLLVLVVGLHALALVWVSTVIEAMGGLGRVAELMNALQAGNIAQVDTAAIRFDLVREAMVFIGRSPWFGVGPGRSYGLDVTDAQLIAWPLMYGIPLALALYGFFAWMFLGTIRVAASRTQVLGLLATALSFFLMLSTGDFMKNYRLFFITVLIAHCIHLAVRERRAGAVVSTN